MALTPGARPLESGLWSRLFHLRNGPGFTIPADHRAPDHPATWQNDPGQGATFFFTIGNPPE